MFVFVFELRDSIVQTVKFWPNTPFGKEEANKYFNQICGENIDGGEDVEDFITWESTDGQKIFECGDYIVQLFKYNIY